MASDSSVFDDPAADHLVLQREQTLAIVLGASEWPFYADFHDAPSFRHSAHDMADYLRAHDGLNLPARNVKVLVNSFDPAPEILEQMWEFIRTRRADLSRNGAPAADLLLYYVGHGGFSDSDAFFLSTRSTNEDDPLATSITAESLGRLVREAAAGLRTYILLDCCFAASASKVFMSGGPVGVAGAQLQDALPPQGDAAAHQNGALPAYGTALLCASGPRSPRKRRPICRTRCSPAACWTCCGEAIVPRRTGSRSMTCNGWCGRGWRRSSATRPCCRRCTHRSSARVGWTWCRCSTTPHAAHRR